MKQAKAVSEEPRYDAAMLFVAIAKDVLAYEETLAAALAQVEELCRIELLAHEAVEGKRGGDAWIDLRNALAASSEEETNV